MSETEIEMLSPSQGEGPPSQNTRSSKIDGIITDFENKKRSLEITPPSKSQLKRARRRMANIRNLEQSLNDLNSQSNDKDKAEKNAKAREAIEAQLKAAKDAQAKAEKELANKALAKTAEKSRIAEQNRISAKKAEANQKAQEAYEKTASEATQGMDPSWVKYLEVILKKRLL